MTVYFLSTYQREQMNLTIALQSKTPILLKSV